MNCKPGDLAVIVSIGPNCTGLNAELSKRSIGIPVRVTHLRASIHPTCTDPIVWNFENPIRVLLNGEWYLVGGCADEHMRPIRDPGDDATDEMLQLLGKPNEVAV